MKMIFYLFLFLIFHSTGSYAVDDEKETRDIFSNLDGIAVDFNVVSDREGAVSKLYYELSVIDDGDWVNIGVQYIVKKMNEVLSIVF